MESQSQSVYDYRFDQEEILVGRADAVDIRLPAEAVSLVHARLVCVDGCTFFIDSSSTNGSIVDRRPAISDEPVEIVTGSQIKIGPFSLEVVSEQDLSDPSQQPNTASFARRMVLDVLNVMGNSSIVALEILSGTMSGVKRQLTAGETLSIGRARECALQLDDADASRRHAELLVEPDGVTVVDLSSKNGIQVNGQAVGGSVRLNHGDQFVVGKTVMRIVDAAEAMLTDLAAEDEPQKLKKRSFPGVRVSKEGLVDAGEPADSDLGETNADVNERREAITTPSGNRQETSAAVHRRKKDAVVWGVGGVFVVVAVALIVYLLTVI